MLIMVVGFPSRCSFVGLYRGLREWVEHMYKCDTGFAFGRQTSLGEHLLFYGQYIFVQHTNCFEMQFSRYCSMLTTILINGLM